ncbi:MAG TPA: hypothetical protein VE616_18235 [Candidatus Udaeobacter sp.]|nr:hypothetical protein [Candidatus Udaeobacter sp.]
MPLFSGFSVNVNFKTISEEALPGAAASDIPSQISRFTLLQRVDHVLIEAGIIAGIVHIQTSAGRSIQPTVARIGAKFKGV